MRIDIHGRAVAVKSPLREYVERALLFSLGRFEDRIRRIRVSIADVNGPRGGADKRCRIQVFLGRLGEVVAEDTDPRIATAVDHASDRAGRAIRRAMDRRYGGRPASMSSVGRAKGSEG